MKILTNSIEPILEKLNSLIPEDKLLHFFYGTIIYALLLIIFMTVFKIALNLSAVSAMIIVMMIAGIKELYDYLHPDIHECSIMDWVFTVSSSIVFTFIIMLGYKLS